MQKAVWIAVAAVVTGGLGLGAYMSTDGEEASARPLPAASTEGPEDTPGPGSTPTNTPSGETEDPLPEELVEDVVDEIQEVVEDFTSGGSGGLSAGGQEEEEEEEEDDGSAGPQGPGETPPCDEVCALSAQVAALLPIGIPTAPEAPSIAAAPSAPAAPDTEGVVALLGGL